MKKLFLGFFVLSLSTAGLAQSYVTCDLKIPDNAVDCPFLGSCPEEVLETSSHQIQLEINSGETVKGRIELKKVAVLDDDLKEKEGKITIFKEDKRDQELKSSKNVKLISYKSRDFINYQIEDLGNGINVNFTSSVNAFVDYIQSEVSFSDYLLLGSNTVAINCKSLNKEIYDEMKAKEEALEQLKKEYEEAASASKQ